MYVINAGKRRVLQLAKKNHGLVLIFSRATTRTCSSPSLLGEWDAERRAGYLGEQF
jgi:hypothetical protein